MYSCHLFLISSASVRSLLFLSFTVPFLTWNVPLISTVFLKRSLVFPILLFASMFFASFVEESILVSPCYSLELCMQLDISFPFSVACRFSFPQLFVKPPQTTTLPFCISFSLGWFWSLTPLQCYKPPSIALQAEDFIPWIYSSLPLYNHKGFALGHSWMA